MHLFARPEGWNDLSWYGHGFAGAWVSTLAGMPRLHCEGGEATKLHPLPLSQDIGNGAEDRADDDLNVTRIQMGVLACELPYQLGLDHCWRETLTWRCLLKLAEPKVSVKQSIQPGDLLFHAR